MALFFTSSRHTCSAKAKKFHVDTKALLNPYPDPDIKDTSFFKPYDDFLREVYETMDREYYLPISEKVYAQFKENYHLKVLSRLKNRENEVIEIKYLGAGLLVKKLKDPTDTFSNFFPPKESQEYRQEALGFGISVGIEGHMIDTGYLVDKVELRSDSYKKGVRPGDIVLKIDDKDVLTLSKEELNKGLFPEPGLVVTFENLAKKTGQIYTAQLEGVQFFKETLSSVPTNIPGMYYIKINQFNQKTGEDITNLMNYFIQKRMNKLVIDLRGNAGGPPLAAREIASLFFPPNTNLFYFQRKNRPKIMLRTIYSPLRYKGKIAILIDRGSGSASELFSWALRKHERSILIGAEPSAGKTFLKSMYPLKDKSMLLLVTSLAYLYNGETYDFGGLKPDFIAAQDVELFGFISKCLNTYYAE